MYGKRVGPTVYTKNLILSCKGESLKQHYVPDLLCFDKVIVELKAVKKIIPEHQAQLINYHKVTGIRVGFLLILGAYPKATIERFVL